jgi:hypothetical protein
LRCSSTYDLGSLLAQDYDDIQVVRQQIHKARGVWARIGEVLIGENATPRVTTKFYKAVVQSVLLYGSKTWNLIQTVLAQLEGFHIHAAYGRLRNTNLAKVCLEIGYTPR